MKNKTAKVSDVHIICSLCTRLPRNSKEAMEINNFGYHLVCEHVKGECQHEDTIDVGDEEHTVIVCVDCEGK